MTLDAAELGGKQLELLREAVPALSRVAILRNPTSPDWAVAKEFLHTSERSLTRALHDFPVNRAEDLAPAFAAMSRSKIGAISVRRDVLVIECHGPEVVRLAAQHRLPAIFNFRDFITAGGLMSYGVNVFEVHKRAATFVDRILRGAPPADLPIEQPTKFELVINLKTAKALGLTMPPSLLARADQVIE
jgi:putative ABC transport system substrate-binding protein